MAKQQVYEITNMSKEAPFRHEIVTVRKARKEHTCAECRLPIAKGEEYCEVVQGGSGLGGLKFPDRTHRSCLEKYLKRR